MKTVIAEKPSVAKDIAKILGATNRKDGYIEGNGYFVTWAFGHLISLAMPEKYGFTSFKKESLPMMPNNFILTPKQAKNKEKKYEDDAGVLKQLNIISELFSKSENIIVATDAGREGELIFRYIYNYLNILKPFTRLWISSLTDNAIKEGFNALKNGKEYDNLYLSAKARSEADWLIGLNASQALSIAGNGNYSLGRVQTPTLAMVCSRFLENKNFVPVPFWQMKLFTEKSQIKFTAISEKLDNKENSKEIYTGLSAEKTASVFSVEDKEVNQEPPLLFDLTNLQKDANRRHGFSADKTLSIAQKLYESKVLTYPRTGSRFIPEDVFLTVPDLLSSNDFAKKNLDFKNLNRKSVNDAKVTDHHALLITENSAEDLSSDEKIIYEMVLNRMLEAFSPKCVKMRKTAVIMVKDTPFRASGSLIKVAGWRLVSGEMADENEEEENATLPDIQQGEILPVEKLELLEKFTKPKPLHTEASLLAAMESAGKEIEDEEEREALKDIGIGTPATRASIIETLFTRDYILREKKNIVPTNKGLAVYEIVKDMAIANATMTGQWEKAFNLIERGQKDVSGFRTGIETATKNIVNELLNVSVGYSKNDDLKRLKCPKCKEESLLLFPKVAKCEKCEFTIFKEIASKALTDNQLMELITKGKTGLIKGFKSKAGKSFEAKVILNEEFKTAFEFAEQKKQK